MSLEYKNFLIKNFGGQKVFIETISGIFIRGILIGIDEHINLLL
jgi:small nuclear ribonucleoprotein (snRNP)-like protein